MKILVVLAALSLGPCLLATARGETPAPSLEQQLLKEDVAGLARDARAQGDASRGAIVFHQPQLACTRCHATGEAISPLGPDLARLGKEATDAYLVESILQPSRVVKKGFESHTVVTIRGTQVTGLLVEEHPDRVVLRDLAQDGKTVTIATRDIDQRSKSPQSLMPTGLVNLLGNRQEFLDLVRYLMEIASGGPERARELRPPPSLFAPPPLPEYEKQIDHAGMIASLDQKSFQRGEAIYGRLCVNCHGTREQPGSLPTSLRFASGTFKNGSDPFRMYQTLTHGYGMMAAQTWMVPRQKYDVIHYIREAYLKDVNPTQYARIDAAYLKGLPRGTIRGPEPSTIEPWTRMNYGPNLNSTYEIGSNGTNFAYKGIAVRLDAGPGGIAQGQSWLVFDHDTLRVAGAWTGKGFIDWNGIHFNGRHQVHPRVVGQVQFANPTGPGWANPTDGSFADPRLRGRDGRPYGPLPRAWAHYRGLYHYGNQVILSYTVGETSVMDMPGQETVLSQPVFTRTFNLGPRKQDLVLQVANHGGPGARLLPSKLDGDQAKRVAIVGSDSRTGTQSGRSLLAAVSSSFPEAHWKVSDSGDLRLTIPAGDAPLRFTLALVQCGNQSEVDALAGAMVKSRIALDLAPFTHGGPPRWNSKIATQGIAGTDAGPFAVDVLGHPISNPWFCQLRFAGLDFFPDGKSAAVCSWDGDVWRVSGVQHPERGLTWQRIASGLFQPLGLKVVAGNVYVTCRDQIVILHDLNEDGETDYYENFNNDHQVTEHFHEFAMGLQTDAQGNFYYAKGARHALPALVPQHGTLLRVSKDGSRTDILATGFRAPNGVCLNPDGTFFLTDQEGHWIPKNRINWVNAGGFYGNMWGYHDVTDSSDQAMKQPVCWITNAFDRSPAEMLWVDSQTWAPLTGSLLNLSYGMGKVFIVPHEKVNGVMQGGMAALPLPVFPTGVMRGRFHPGDGQLYVCGMFAWAGNVQQPGGLFRIRRTDKPVYLPTGLEARRSGMAITFSGVLDRKSAGNPASYAVKTWSLKRSANYGSDHINEKPARITGVRLSQDGKTVILEIADLQATWCMEIRYAVKGEHGENVDGVIHNTIHQLHD